jgi:hypothetical protein
MLGTINVKNHSGNYILHQSKRNQNTISQYTKQVYMRIQGLHDWMQDALQYRGNVWAHKEAISCSEHTAYRGTFSYFCKSIRHTTASGVTSHHPQYFQPHCCQLQINLHKKFWKATGPGVRKHKPINCCYLTWSTKRDDMLTQKGKYCNTRKAIVMW